MPIDRQNQPLFARTFAIHANTPCLIKLATAIKTRIAGMIECGDLPLAGSLGNPVRPCQQVTGACLKTEPVERIALQRGSDLFGQIIGHDRSIAFATELERPRQSGAQLP